MGAYCDAECVGVSAVFHGFLLNSDGFASIDVPGARSTVTLGTNARLDVVGLYIEVTGAIHGFLLPHGGDSSAGR